MMRKFVMDFCFCELWKSTVSGATENTLFLQHLGSLVPLSL